MGEVYRARDTRLKRHVAVKVLTATDARRITRLEREARAISRVSHPHICALHDIGSEDGLAYLVMEYVEGDTLARRLDGGPLPIDQALSIATQIAEALDAAHTAGVIHRDLKPSNVMLTASGVKLLDFGLAKLRDVEPDPNVPASTQSSRLSEDGAVLGTYPYMAPEQVAGGHVDGRADIFALGVVIYEMVSGTRPFEAPTRPALAAAILTRQPASLSSVSPAVPPALDRVVDQCLVKDPEGRWQTARDLAAELRWIAQEVAGPQAPSSASRVQTPRRRRPVWATIAGIAVLLAGAIAAWEWVARGLVVGEPPIPRFTQVTFRAGTISSARFAPDGDTVVYGAAWQGQPYDLFVSRRGSAESRSLGIRGAKLLAVSGSGELALLRGGNSTLNFFDAAGGTLARVSLAGGGPRDVLDGVVSADWIPGTDQLAVARTDGQIEFPIGTKIYKPAGAGIRVVRVAPGGDRLAAIQMGPVGPESVRIVVLDRSGTIVTSSRWTDSAGLAWSPDGREVWFSATRQYASPVLWAMSMQGETRVLVPTDPEPHTVQDVFRDGRLLLATHMRRVGFCCVRPGDTVPRELAWFDFSMPEALSADGSTVVFGDRPVDAPGTVYLRKTDGSDAIRLGEGYPEDLSPEGSWVLVAHREGATARLALLPTGSGSPRPLPAGSLERIGEANFLPDGRQVVFGGRERGRPARIYVQRLDDGSEARPISPEGVRTNALATPDGRFVWGVSPASGHALYAVADGSPRPLPLLTAQDEPLQWSPDAGYLYVRRRDSWPPAVDRIDMSTGRRAAWRTVFPADPVGIDNVLRILITPDGTSYCHDYARLLTNLFVVDGVR